ncbi:MAG: hypothetical protein L0332_25465 [Chloroflexi bacterium]|nr:hypothetical protein [Chloroflexota bacterium]MCI0730047.1 hypothetical protein [Chloroflexota bacterium]
MTEQGSGRHEVGKLFARLLGLSVLTLLFWLGAPFFLSGVIPIIDVWNLLWLIFPCCAGFVLMVNVLFLRALIRAVERFQEDEWPAPKARQAQASAFTMIERKSVQLPHDRVLRAMGTVSPSSVLRRFGVEGFLRLPPRKIGRLLREGWSSDQEEFLEKLNLSRDNAPPVISRALIPWLGDIAHLVTVRHQIVEPAQVKIFFSSFPYQDAISQLTSAVGFTEYVIKGQRLGAVVDGTMEVDEYVETVESQGWEGQYYEYEYHDVYLAERQVVEYTPAYPIAEGAQQSLLAIRDKGIPLGDDAEAALARLKHEYKTPLQYIEAGNKIKKLRTYYT